MDGRFFFFVSFFLSFCSAEKKKRKGGLGVAGRVESRWRGWGVGGWWLGGVDGWGEVVLQLPPTGRKYRLNFLLSSSPRKSRVLGPSRTVYPGRRDFLKGFSERRRTGNMQMFPSARSVWLLEQY